MLLTYATTKELRPDREVVRAAVSQNGEALIGCQPEYCLRLPLMAQRVGGAPPVIPVSGDWLLGSSKNGGGCWDWAVPISCRRRGYMRSSFRLAAAIAAGLASLLSVLALPSLLPRA